MNPLINVAKKINKSSNSIYSHPQIMGRMNQGEYWFIKTQNEGYSTTLGPMTYEEANRELEFNKRMGRKSEILKK